MIGNFQGEEIYKIIFNTISEGLILVDSRGQIIFSNPRASDLFGYTAEEFKHLSVEDLIPMSFRKKHVEHRDTYHKNPSQRTMGIGMTLEGLKKNGLTFPVEISLNHVEKNGERYVVALITDVTFEKEREEEINKLNEELEDIVEERTNELRESQKLYQTIARNFPDGTINVFDENLNYVFVEGQALYAIGITSDKLIGTSYLDRINPEVRPTLEQTLKEVFNGENKTFEIRYNDYYYELNAVPLLSDDKGKEKIKRILVVEHNVTKQKNAEERVLKALEKEKQLNELKSRFVSMASHEFRTPLSTILSSSSLGKKYLEKDGDVKDKVITHLKKIDASVHNLTSILNDFLSLEKIDSGVTRIKSETFSLCILLDEVKEDISTLSTYQYQLIIHKEKIGDCVITSDPNCVKNILINLISNAVKYSHENGTITITIKPHKEGYTVEIKDEGIGIPKEEQKMLFTRFFRAHNATNIQGTGLGLHIVKRYIDQLQGDIQVESTEGKGSTFTVYLPNLK